jgi:hypothetical protein
MTRIERATGALKGSVVAKLASPCIGPSAFSNRRDSLKQAISMSFDKYEALNSSDFKIDRSEMKRQAFKATRSIYGVVLLACLTVMGFTLLGSTLSLNALKGEPKFMVTLIQMSAVVFQINFAFIALFVWHANDLFTYTDVAMCIVTPLADQHCFTGYSSKQWLSVGEMATFCVIQGYMIVRLWCMTVKPRHQCWSKRSMEQPVLERLDVVWVTRSASQVAEILPGINRVWDDLVKLWGREQVDTVCRISIFATDKDEQANRLLKQEIRRRSLAHCVNFERPDFAVSVDASC